MVSVCIKLSCLSACKKKNKLHQLPIWVIWACLTHTHIKWWYKFEETFDINLQAKDQLHHSHFPWDIAKLLHTSCFEYFGHVFAQPQWYYHLVENFCVLCLSAGKKSTSSPMIFLRYCKGM